MARSHRPAHVHGVLPVDKPPGWTSHDVVGRMRRLFGQRQVGHSGTLDPMATGALIVLLGEATKLSRFVQDGRKTYVASISLGTRTTSDDADGEALEEVAVPPLAREQVQEALQEFVGEYDQVPPSVSAVKIDGKRAYRRARDGEQVEIPPRRVRCFEAELLRCEERLLEVQVVVASGYYVRSLGRDLAGRLGTLGHLCSLRRTQNAGFAGSSLVDLPTLQSSDDPARFVRPMLSVWSPDDRIVLESAQADALSHGKRIPVAELLDPSLQQRMEQEPQRTWAAVRGEGLEQRLIAVVQSVGGEVRVVRGFRIDHP